MLCYVMFFIYSDIETFRDYLLDCVGVFQRIEDFSSLIT